MPFVPKKETIYNVKNQIEWIQDRLQGKFINIHHLIHLNSNCYLSLQYCIIVLTYIFTFIHL